MTDQHPADGTHPLFALGLVTAIVGDPATVLPYLAKLSDDHLTAVGLAALQLAQLAQAVQQQRAAKTPETQT